MAIYIEPDEGELSSAWETFFIVLPSFFYVLLSNIIISTEYSKFHNSNLKQLLIEFIIIIIPCILTNSILTEYSLIIIIIISTVLFIKIRRILPESSKIYKKFDKSKIVSKNRDFITNIRSTINVLSVIAILAVDFHKLFPGRLGKTRHYGYSLMDLGVGLYVYANGIIDGLKPNFRRSLKAIFVLIVLGTLRFLLTRLIDYHVNVIEYGLHWNFFITLAVTKLIVQVLFIGVEVKYMHILGILLMILHQIILALGIEDFVTSPHLERNNFIAANKEGIFSTLGYVNIYLLSAYISYYIDFKKGKNVSLMSFKFVIISLGCLIATQICEYHFNISRQLANPAYCFWILFIATTMSGLFFLGEILKERFKFFIGAPFIYEIVNYNPLLFFLFSNILTGIINVCFDLDEVSVFFGVIDVSAYMLINFGLMYILYLYKLKL